MTSSNYRCRKCRTVLFVEESLLTCHTESLQDHLAKPDDKNGKCYDLTSNVLFVDEHKMNDWIKEQIDSGEWIKGRLICPTNHCGARLGSFNFINGEYCHCGQHQLPSIQFNRSKVDEPFKS